MQVTQFRVDQVQQLAAQGCTTKVIAHRLGMAETTVERVRQGRLPVVSARGQIANQELGAAGGDASPTMVSADDESAATEIVWCSACRCHVIPPCQACRVRSYGQRLRRTGQQAASRTDDPPPGDARLAQSVAELTLPDRLAGYLAQQGILTVYQLLRQTPQSLLSLPNLGPRSLQQIFTALERIGFYRGQ